MQVESEFILESERESFIEQVREVIENADEKGLERDANSQTKKTVSLLLNFYSLSMVCLNLLVISTFASNRPTVIV